MSFFQRQQQYRYSTWETLPYRFIISKFCKIWDVFILIRITLLILICIRSRSKVFLSYFLTFWFTQTIQIQTGSTQKIVMLWQNCYDKNENKKMYTEKLITYDRRPAVPIGIQWNHTGMHAFLISNSRISNCECYGLTEPNKSYTRIMLDNLQ